MVKKILPFLCTLAPLYAFGADSIILADGEYQEISTGSGTTVDVVNMAGDLFVLDEPTLSPPATSYGDLYILNGTSVPFGISSNGDIDIDGGVNVSATRGIQLSGVGDITIGGAVASDGSFAILNGNSLNVGGNITAEDVVGLNAKTITIHDVSATDTLSITTSTGNLSTGAIMASGATSTITSAGNIASSGTVQNAAGGNMAITSAGTFGVTGNLENSGGAATNPVMTVNVGPANNRQAMTVSGTMKNDNVNGNLSVYAASLNVNGGSVAEASFVNSGTATFIIDGTASFANGFDLSNMGANSKLTMTVGGLTLGTGTGSVLNGIANDKSVVDIAVTNTALNIGAISNGTLNGGASNSNANLTLSGVGGVGVASVHNYGTLLDTSGLYSLKISSTAGASDPGDVTIAGGVFGATGTKTIITAEDTLGVGADISNFGTMTLTGKNVELAGVSNGDVNTAGGTLNIYGSTAAGGSVTVDGSVVNTNNGTTNINAADITVTGAISNDSGTLNVSGGTSASELSAGSILVSGGTVNLNSWGGGIETGGMTVSGGVLNLDNSVHDLASSGAIDIGGNVYLANSGAAVTNNGDVYITALGGNVDFASDSTLTIDGGIVATAAGTHMATFDGTEISVNGATTNGGGFGVDAQNGGYVVFGTDASSSLDVVNGLRATNGGTIEIYSGDATASTLVESKTGDVGGKFIMHGSSFVADTGAIQIDDGIVYGGSATYGMVIDGSVASFELSNNATGNTSDITVGGGITIGSGNTLTMNSANDLSVTGAVVVNGGLIANATNGDATFNNAMTVGATNNTSASASVSAESITVAGLNNYGSAEFTTTNGDFESMGAVSSSGALAITSADDVSVGGALSISNGTADISATNVTLNSLALTGGVTTVAAGTQLSVTNAANITGNVVQGTAAEVLAEEAALKLVNVPTVSTKSLTITNGGFIEKSGTANYTITNATDLGTGLNIANGANVTMTSTSGSITSAGNFVNNGTLSLNATGNGATVSLGDVTNNSVLTINTKGMLAATSFATGASAKTSITSNGMNLTGESTTTSKALDIAKTLYQNKTGDLANGDFNVIGNNYTISASGVHVGAITQTGNSVMQINTSDLTVDNGINATNLTIAAQNDTSGNPIWSNINVGGNVSGGVKIYGLKHMVVNGNYTFDKNSLLHAAALSGENYWATVSLNDDNTLGQIVNNNNDPVNALVYVDKQFVANVSAADIGGDIYNGSLVAPEIGINLHKAVNPGSAIWFVYADDGLNELATKIRNLKVNFCNNDGSICFNYFDTLAMNSDQIMNSDNDGTTNDLPIYLSVRDYNRDGVNDSIYIVFDPRFGGPVSVFDTESIVERVNDSTDGEVSAANALDDMVAGQLKKKGFDTDSPIETIPVVFNGTNLSQLANELYNRMEYYVTYHDGTPLARLARLVQPREIEQVAGSIVLNEHTSFRDFEDHMFDEFIWNRNRNLNKVWFDADFGFVRQNVADDKVVNGNRFNITAGFDFQSSTKTILGLMARVSQTTGENSDTMDLSYRPGETITGHNRVNVADTNIGFGGYLMHTLGFKSRVYGNAMLDLHLLNVSREQNYVDDITGLGTSVSLISEWGLMHDWLNQYIVGNLYTRFGYNFGFSLKENADGDEYMHLKSDGYFILTPGYSLIAQKRIYTSPWFQIRPYASIGIEYDVLGAPDVARYKFAPAKKYSDYDIEINPLWANIGGGVEMLSANGLQIGLDYRYQYNNDIQLHNIKLSGSFRF